MIKRKDLVSLLDEWLKPENIKDHTLNGLQFEGKENIQHIGFAVDISLEVFQKASELNIDFLITHHGMIWDGINKITGFEKKRLEILFKHDINVYCSHLPLDIHPKFGNNTCIIDLLNAYQTNESFFDVGYIATFSPSISYENLIKLIHQKISNQLVEMKFGPSQITQIAVCSGGATLNINSLFEAYKKNVYTILSGETNSLFYHYAKELGINIICAGHYATETFGLQKLLTTIKNYYGNTYIYTFIDLPTGF